MTTTPDNDAPTLPDLLRDLQTELAALKSDTNAVLLRLTAQLDQLHAGIAELAKTLNGRT